MSPECRKTRVVPPSLNARILFPRVGITSGIQSDMLLRIDWKKISHLTKIKFVRCIESHMIHDNEIIMHNPKHRS